MLTLLLAVAVPVCLCAAGLLVRRELLLWGRARTSSFRYTADDPRRDQEAA